MKRNRILPRLLIKGGYVRHWGYLSTANLNLAMVMMYQLNTAGLARFTLMREVFQYHSLAMTDVAVTPYAKFCSMFMAIPPTYMKVNILTALGFVITDAMDMPDMKGYIALLNPNSYAMFQTEVAECIAQSVSWDNVTDVFVSQTANSQYTGIDIFSPEMVALHFKARASANTIYHSGPGNFPVAYDSINKYYLIYETGYWIDLINYSINQLGLIRPASINADDSAVYWLNGYPTPLPKFDLPKPMMVFTQTGRIVIHVSVSSAPPEMQHFDLDMAEVNLMDVSVDLDRSKAYFSKSDAVGSTAPIGLQAYTGISLMYPWRFVLERAATNDIRLKAFNEIMIVSTGDVKDYNVDGITSMSLWPHYNGQTHSGIIRRFGDTLISVATSTSRALRYGDYIEIIGVVHNENENLDVISPGTYQFGYDRKMRFNRPLDTSKIIAGGTFANYHYMGNHWGPFVRNSPYTTDSGFTVNQSADLAIWVPGVQFTLTSLFATWKDLIAPFSYLSLSNELRTWESPRRL